MKKYLLIFITTMFFPITFTGCVTETARVTEFDQQGISWELGDTKGVITGTDVHVIDKGVAYV